MMSVTASLTVIPENLLNKERTYLKRGAKLDFSAKNFFCLDKTWHDFHLVFREMPPPLSYAIMGESFRKLETESHDDFIFLSATVVQEVNTRLSKFSENQMISALKKRRILSPYTKATYHRENFRSLKKAYQTAAKARAWIAILIG